MQVALKLHICPGGMAVARAPIVRSAPFEPPFASPSPVAAYVTASPESGMEPIPIDVTGARPVYLRAQRARGVGFIVAACVHLLVLALALSFSGSAGTSGPVSPDAIVIELIAEPPGAVAGQTAVISPISDETAPPLPPPEAETPADEAQMRAELAAIPEPSPEPPPEPEPAPLGETEPTLKLVAPPEQRTPVDQKPSIVNLDARAGREPAGAQSAQSSRPDRKAVSADNSAVIDAYKRTVATKIARNKPASDTAASAQGVALISFTVLVDGRVGQLKIVKSSGHKTLDQAAMAAVGKSSPFPPPPTGAGRSFTVPIRFNAIR
jgi:protein TonB